MCTHVCTVEHSCFGQYKLACHCDHVVAHGKSCVSTWCLSAQRPNWLETPTWGLVHVARIQTSAYPETDHPSHHDPSVKPIQLVPHAPCHIPRQDTGPLAHSTTPTLQHRQHLTVSAHASGHHGVVLHNRTVRVALQDTSPQTTLCHSGPLLWHCTASAAPPPGIPSQAGHACDASVAPNAMHAGYACLACIWPHLTWSE